MIESIEWDKKYVGSIGRRWIRSFPPIAGLESFYSTQARSVFESHTIYQLVTMTKCKMRVLNRFQLSNRQSTNDFLSTFFV